LRSPRRSSAYGLPASMAQFTTVPSGCRTSMKSHLCFLGAKIGYRVEVFWDLDEVERWLDERQSQQP
jgi:hypothetical protein